MAVATATLVAGTLITLHLRLLTIYGYPVTIAVPALWALTLWLFNPLSDARSATKSFFIIWGICVSALLNSVVNVAGLDVAEFAKSFALVLLSVPPVLLAALAPPKPDRIARLRMGLWVAIFVVSLYGTLQFITARFLGTAALYNPFGSRQYLYQYAFDRYIDKIRAPAFYLEPSFAALVIIGTMLALFALDPRRRWFAALVGGLGVWATQSLAGMVSFVLVLLLATIASSRNARRSRLQSLALVLVMGALIATSAAYLGQRVGSVGVSGTSVHYRLVAPLEVLRDVLLEHPTGQPLGSMESVVSEYGLRNGDRVGSTIDNGLYVVVYSFGWLGLAGLTYLGAMVFRRGRSLEHKMEWWMFSVGLLLLPTFTGGVFLPEFALMVVVVAAAMRFWLLEAARHEGDRHARTALLGV